jgi:hypothetical protein
MNLLELQRRMAGAIMTPLSQSGGSFVRDVAEELIKRNIRLTSFERLEIYRESYWYRALGSLEDDFPGSRAVLGPRMFKRLAQSYLAEVPSQSFTIRNLGSRLPGWLKNHPEYRGANPALTDDMVQLEWAHIEAFDGAAEKPLGPEDLIELHDEMLLALQPHISLLELSFPVDDLRIKVQDASLEGRGAASNAVIRRKERHIVHRYGRVRPVPTFLAVHRVDFVVYYRRLEEEEFRILTALRNGLSIGDAVSLIQDESQSSLEAWFASWARMGWLCRPRVKEDPDEELC